jgi:hypothetical protein
MRPDGTDRTVIWSHEGQLCSADPQWYPDPAAGWLGFSALPLEEWSFPMIRKIILLARDGSSSSTPVTVLHEDRDCVLTEIAFSPDGSQVAYVDGSCQPWVKSAGISPAPEEAVDEFPWSWTGMVFPQWEGNLMAEPESVPVNDEADDLCGPEGEVLFFDDFENGDTPGWNFHPGAGPGEMEWPVGGDAGNHFLVGRGHSWAENGQHEWLNYALHVRYRHVTPDADAQLNIRLGEGRYYIHLRGGLLKRDFPPAGEANTLLDRWDYRPDREWHQFTLLAVEGHVEALLDGELVGVYEDPDPLPPGHFGLENLAGTMWYDEVVVCGGR